MLLVRALVVAAVAGGRSVAEVSMEFACARSFVYRTLDRYAEDGRDGLWDGRAWNGRPKVDDAFHAGVRELLQGTPREHGYIRSTWTRELLAIVMQSQGYVRISVSTMGRVLVAIRARQGHPKPIVKCPLSERQKRRRLRTIRDLIDNCPDNEVVVYEDEVDIHLNPKIGVDWMNLGDQKLVMTPGQNAKAYVAGALDAHTRDVIWVGGGRKNSDLFIDLLGTLDAHYREAALIHVVLDNYSIHKSRKTLSALRRSPRIRLHFLPPYCPDHNAIERLWLDLHAQVTRNHPHSNLVPLCAEVAQFLDEVSPWISQQDPLLLKAA
ncbi:IS630 family transposase [bacterium AH-315-N03]|nr:IS630 family transposase [bacterium AH-315-N03]